MARIGSAVLILALLAAVGWLARHDSAAGKAGAEINGEWAAAHESELRRALNLPGTIELNFKEVGESSVPDYRLLKFELVAGERRRPLRLYVSHDGRRLLYDRVYELDDPFRLNRQRIDLTNAPARGPAEAPVTIVEYSDYTCGYCRRFFEQLEEPLLERYGGRVRFVYKHFPLVGLRAWSEDAALAGACAYRQGNDRFWALHPRLFQSPARLKERTPALVELARDAGLDLSAFKSCLEKREALAEVERDVAEGEALGVEGTPTFYVNGRPIEGLVPPERFFQVVDEELAAATRRPR
jgi:protein-disulfide isomerase